MPSMNQWVFSYGWIENVNIGIKAFKGTDVSIVSISITFVYEMY